MKIRLEIVAAAVAPIILSLRGEPTACPLATTLKNVNSTNDVDDLIDILQCTGGGALNVTWKGRVAIDRTIDVSSGIHLTVNGYGSVKSGHADGDTSVDVIDGQMTTGIFSVSNGSTLRLSNIILEAGNSPMGGAVAVLSSSRTSDIVSSVTINDCTFANNNASLGGNRFIALCPSRD